MSSVTIGGAIYNQIGSGFWIKQDGSGPYTVDVAAGVASVVGAAGNPAGVLTLNIASGGEVYAGTVAVSAPATQLKSRLDSTIFRGAQRIKFVYANRYLLTNGEQDGPASISLKKVSAELNGVTTPALFSGARNLTIAAGDLDKTSDWINIAVKPGDVVYHRSETDVSTSGYISAYRTNGNQSWVYNPANEVDDVDSVGTMTAPSGAVVAFPYHPMMIIGEVAAGQIAVIGLTDSIGVGLADIGSDSTKTNMRGNGGGGFVRRAMWAAALPYMNFGISGRSLDASNTNHVLLDTVLKYHTHCIQQMVINDLAFSSVATVQSRFNGVWAILKAGLVGQKIIVQTPCTMYTTTTDGCTTLANQTVFTSFGLNGKGDQINNWLKQQIGIKFNNFVDVYAGIRDTTDPTKWTPGTFSSTLTSAVLSNATSIPLNDMPDPGAALIFDPAGANHTSNLDLVLTITGTVSPFTAVTQGTPGVAQLISAVVKDTNSADGLHPTGVPNIKMANKLLAEFPRN